MLKIYFLPMLIFCTSALLAQNKYSTTPDIQPEYKNLYNFTAKLDEKTNVLSFTTNAPITVAILSTYSSEELSIRKGKDYTNTYTKKGETYFYDLNKPLLKDKYAYWLKVAWGNNGAPLGEYFFKKIKEEKANAETPGKKVKETSPSINDAIVDPARPTLQTNIKCEAGKIKIIKALTKLEGVFEAKINIKTGALKLRYSSDGTSLNDIVEAILENGFDVLDDGQGNGEKKSANPSKNPCAIKINKKIK